MYCGSPFPGYYFSTEVIPGVVAFPWPQANIGIHGSGGTGYNVQLQHPSVDHYAVCDKEVMRQTLLKHEAVFRYQVHELHRLYKRQKELMHELKGISLRFQTSSLEYITSLMQNDIAQRTSFTPGWPVMRATGSDPSSLSARKCQGPIVGVDANSNPRTKFAKEEASLTVTEAAKSRKRVLDLELPGDHYLDSEDEENVVENVADVPQLERHPPKESSMFLNGRDSKRCSLHFIGSASLVSSDGRKNCLIDLNEPVQLDEPEFPNSFARAEPSTCCKNNSERCIMQKSAHDPCVGSVISYPTICDGNSTSVQNSPPRCCEDTNNRKSLENGDSDFAAPRCSSSENGRCVDGEDEMENSVNALDSSRKPFFDGEAPGPRFHAKVRDVISDKREGKTGGTNSRLAYDATYPSVKWSKDDLAVNVESGSNISNLNSNIDLNSCVDGDGPSLQSRPRNKFEVLKETDLEGPLSPENKERPPPRREAKDRPPLETPLQPAKDGEYSVTELDKVAAETIISMSLYGVKSCLEAVIAKPPEPVADCLDWFAEAVSSMAAVLEEEDSTLQTGDYLKTNKFRQVARECEDIRHKCNVDRKEDTGDEPLTRQQGCRGRGKKKKKKVVRKKAVHALGVPRRAPKVCVDNLTRRKKNTSQNHFVKWKAHDEPIMNQPLKRGAKDEQMRRCLGGWGSRKGRRRARMARPSFHGLALA